MGRFAWSRLPYVYRWFSLVLASASIALGVGLVLRHREASVACATSPAGAAGHACALPGAVAAAVAKGAKDDDGLADLPAGAVVVELTSEDCPACRAMEPVLRAAREQCQNAGANVVRVDVESTRGGALASHLNVIGTPTLVLFDASHEEVARVVGAQPLADVRRALEQAYGIACAGSARPTGG